LALGPQIERLGAIGSTVETQRVSLAATLRDTSITLADASSGFSGFEQSLAQARASTDRAAALARDVSGTMSGIGRAMRLTVLGVQPFAELAPQFERASEQLQLLGTDLDGIGTAMTRNVGDVQRAGADLARVQRQVEQLAIAAETTRIPAGTGGDLAAIRLGAYALAAWLAGLALACLLLGIAIWRSASVTPELRGLGRSTD
jgi:ABC-type transporter Mla subunit MlaD